MRILLVIVAIMCLAVSSYAVTTPGTIITALASVSYYDSAGNAMPQQSSNASNVLVINSNPPRTVFLNIYALYYGPSTVGRTVKVVGGITTDATGVMRISDGSVGLDVDQNGVKTSKILSCKIDTTFLTPSCIAFTETGRMIVTGISQTDTDGSPVVVPSGDSDIQRLSP